MSYDWFLKYTLSVYIQLKKGVFNKVVKCLTQCSFELVK